MLHPRSAKVARPIAAAKRGWYGAITRVGADFVPGFTRSARLPYGRRVRRSVAVLAHAHASSWPSLLPPELGTVPVVHTDAILQATIRGRPVAQTHGR
jgi:hypothetical protein